jgi:hypothetical protein
MCNSYYLQTRFKHIPCALCGKIQRVLYALLLNSISSEREPGETDLPENSHPILNVVRSNVSRKRTPTGIMRRRASHILYETAAVCSLLRLIRLQMLGD